MNPIIDIHNLSFSYPDGKQALDGVSLSVMAGEKIAVVGANGAGKSTLLLHFNGILSGIGKIYVNGMEMNKHNLGQIRAWVGIVFQNPDDQLFSTSVFEDVAYGPIYQGLDRIVVRTRVDEALANIDMREYADRNPYHLSSGEKKRISIATVLSMQPEVLVLDEPTAGLDPHARRQMIELLEELPQTMVIATHDLGLADRLTRRLILLDRGKVVADAATAQLLRDDVLLDRHGLR